MNWFQIIQMTLQVTQAVSALILIVLVLIHSPKGDGLGSIGSMAHLFTSQKSAEAGLTRLTMWVAGIFFVASLILGYYFTYQMQ